MDAFKGQVEALLGAVIRPLIEADGGRIDLVEASTGRIVLRMSAACTGCPGAPYTRARVIEPLLRAELGSEVSIRFEQSAPPNKSNSKTA